MLRRTFVLKIRATAEKDPIVKYEMIRLKNKMFAAANHARQVSMDASSSIEYCITSWLIVNKLHHEYQQKKEQYESFVLQEKEKQLERIDDRSQHSSKI